MNYQEMQMEDEKKRKLSEIERQLESEDLDWEQAESSLLNAEQLEINSINDVFNAFAELELAQGLTLEKP